MWYFTLLNLIPVLSMCGRKEHETSMCSAERLGENASTIGMTMRLLTCMLMVRSYRRLVHILPAQKRLTVTGHFGCPETQIVICLFTNTGKPFEILIDQPQWVSNDGVGWSRMDALRLRGMRA